MTWDSTPSGEWAETDLKACRLLALASARPEAAFADGLGVARFAHD